MVWLCCLWALSCRSEASVALHIYQDRTAGCHLPHMLTTTIGAGGRAGCSREQVKAGISDLWKSLPHFICQRQLMVQCTGTECLTLCPPVPTACSLPKTDLGKAPEDHSTYQCRRKACRKAESPSMTSRMATVSTANAAKMMKMAMRPAQPLLLSPLCITMVQRTSDSSAEGNKKENSAEQQLWTDAACSLPAHPLFPVCRIHMLLAKLFSCFVLFRYLFSM